MFRRVLCVFTLVTFACVSHASAHFPWLVIDDDGHARVFFGEGLTDQDYHLPEAVAAAKVWQVGADDEPAAIALSEHEEDSFIGLRSTEPVEGNGSLHSQVVYGVYHGSKLTYYIQCFMTKNAGLWPAEPEKDLPLHAKLRVLDDSLTVTLLRDGRPVEGVSVTLTNDRSDDRLSADTDDKGQVEYSLDLVSEGRNGLMAMLVDKDSKGKVSEEDYTSATHIVTVTFNGKPQTDAATASVLPPLPEAIASFGAAVADDWLYVYSGHTGTAHAHSRENLSRHFCRAKLDGSTAWEELPMPMPLQGLAMVAHEGKLYRIGGLDARNKPDEEDDLHSVDSFACFDPTTREWVAMPSLPTGRSSHNATVIGDTIYVVGGWELSGGSDGNWQSGALAFDLSDPGAEWRELPEPPFRRRALAVGHADGKLVAMSGMTDGEDLSQEVFLFDPATGEWSSGPEFPGDPFHGFGLSAWNVGGVLYAGGMEGVVYRLSDNLSEWVEATRMTTPRFFHQLVPNGQGGMLAVAGASPELGHVAGIEELQL